MRIDRIELFHVAMPLMAAWRTAASEETAIQSVFVRMMADGQEGWAETAPHRAPLYCPDWGHGVFTVMRDWLAPMVLGRDIASGESLQAMLKPIKGNQFAKAGLDVAWWDCYARARDLPVWQMIGGSDSPVVVGADIGVQDTIDALLFEIAAAETAGFERIKLKYRPGWGLEMVQAVRSTFPNLTIHIDCNGAYTLDDLAMFRELDDYELAMIEQPLSHDDLIDHAKLQAKLETPLCLDESITSIDRARQAIEIGSCRFINLKIGRVGGLTPAIAIHDLCADHGMPCWVGSMIESALGQGHMLALASLPNMKYPADIFPSSRFYAVDLAEPEIRLTGRSAIALPHRSGFGAVPNRERLARHALNVAVLAP